MRSRAWISKNRKQYSKEGSLYTHNIRFCIFIFFMKEIFADDNKMSLSRSSSNASIPIWDSSDPGNSRFIIGKSREPFIDVVRC